MNDQRKRHAFWHSDTRAAKQVAQRLLADDEAIVLAFPYRLDAGHRRRPAGLLAFTATHILDIDLHLDRTASSVRSAHVVAQLPRDTPMTVRRDLPPILGRTKGLWIQIADTDPVFVTAEDWWNDPPVRYW